MNTKLRSFALLLLVSLLTTPAARAIDIDRAKALLEVACSEAVRLPSLPDFSERIRALEADDVERSALKEHLDRLTARMARRYVAGSLSAGGDAVAACVSANPDARVNILMLDDPSYHRRAARQSP